METEQPFLPTPAQPSPPPPPPYGLCGFYPKPLQCLSNKKAFLVVFCLTCVLQGTFHTYFVAVITTLEKLFDIPSRTIGTLMMAGEVGQVSSSLLLPYLAQTHRPRWMASCMALFSFATLLAASPHFLFDLTPKEASNSTHDFCTLENDGVCGEESVVTTQNNYVFGIIFFSLLSIGCSQTAIFTLGIPFLDDNVGGRDSALYFSITIGVRILGPVLGFVLGSLCTRLYIHPFSPPPYPPTDPRWLGAWWLGLLFISISLFFASFIMGSFPPSLNSSPPPKHSRSLKNFPQTLKRLLSNKFLILRTFSSVFHLLPISGLYTFLPKYLESQFHLAAFEANIVTGIGGILVMGVGIFGSGWVLRRREPGGRGVAVWVAGAAAVYSLGILCLVWVGCGGEEGGVVGVQGVFGGKPSCSTPHCTECPRNYAPICGDNFTYFNPCHAGCTPEQSSPTTFNNCSCIPSSSATLGHCQTPCTLFPLYLGIFIFIVLVHSTSEVGSMLLTLRCVEPRDKAMALGVIQCAIGIFGNVPCPLIYGAVVDKACMLWGGCGAGHCLEYDTGLFRVYFHGLTSLLMSIAFLIDLFVISLASKINMK